MENYRLNVDAYMQRFPVGTHDPYDDYKDKRYPSLESAVKSAQYITETNNIVCEVDVFKGLDWICTISKDEPIEWRNGVALL